MKKRILLIALLFALLLIPAAVFADSGGFVQSYPGWNKDRSIYYGENKKPVTGLFKAKMSDGVGALFYAPNKDGKIVKKAGIITVSGNKTRYLRSKDSEGHWGFRKVPSSDNNTYTYFVGNNGEGAIVEDSKFYKGSKGKYFVQPNGTVKTTAGFITVNDKKYFIKKGGRLRTSPGWLTYKGKRYRIQSNGTVRTKEGAFSLSGRKYVIISDGSVCTKIGPVSSNGKMYFVKNEKGQLGTFKTYKIGNKIYHVNRNGTIKIGRHKWKDNQYYYSTGKGYLKTRTGMVKRKGVRFLVKKGGLVVVNQKFLYNNKYYIAGRKGTLYTGLFNWNGVLYYALENGALKPEAGVVKIGDYSYFVAAGGVVYVNQRFWGNGDLYVADDNGHLLTGFFTWGGNRFYGDSDYRLYHNQKFTVAGNTYVTSGKGYIKTGIFTWGGTRYYADTSGVIDTSARIIRYNGNYYYNNAGGGLAVYKWVYVNNKHYYAGKSGAFKTKNFWYPNKNDAKRVAIHPASDGTISDDEYYKAMNR